MSSGGVMPRRRGHTSRSSQPAKDKICCSPSPAVAADCRRFAPVLSGTEDFAVSGWCAPCTVGIPRFRFAPLGMTKQCTIISSPFCHVERRAFRPEVETSRHTGTSTVAIRTGSRRYDRRDPSTTLGVTETCRLERSRRRSRKVSTLPNIRHGDSHRFPLIRPSGSLDFVRDDNKKGCPNIGQPRLSHRSVRAFRPRPA